MREAVLFLVPLSLALLVFTVGLQSRLEDLVYVWRQPRMLLSGILAVNVVVPVVAVLMVLLLPIAPVTRAGLVAMAIAPMAPFLPGKMLKLGAGPSFAVGVFVALGVMSVLVVPASVWIIGQLTEREIALPIVPLARFVLTSVLVPIVAGIMVATIWPRAVRPVAKVAMIASYVVLVPVVLLILIKSAGGMAALAGDGTLLAIAVIVVAGLVAGYALGGPQPENRAALAQAAVTRHPGIAVMVIQGNDIDQRAMLAVILLLLGSLAISTLMQSIARKARAAAGQAGETTR